MTRRLFWLTALDNLSTDNRTVRSTWECISGHRRHRTERVGRRIPPVRRLVCRDCEREEAQWVEDRTRHYLQEASQ